VIYFIGSVSGLAAGAPANFRDVWVGRVSSVTLHLTPDARVSRIPVMLELFPLRSWWTRHPDWRQSSASRIKSVTDCAGSS
jgi:hypothetical protein